MDVRCERCRTEYEFDDAKITDSGVTVRCTVCSHVFKVRRRPLLQGEVVTLDAPPAARARETLREWRVRQANGNQLTFNELTTLQKWIVERKVLREDEVSLTGESWKRLGNIAELASFFQLVDAADRAASAAPPPARPAPHESDLPFASDPAPAPARPPPIAPFPFPSSPPLASALWQRPPEPKPTAPPRAPMPVAAPTPPLQRIATPPAVPSAPPPSTGAAPPRGPSPRIESEDARPSLSSAITAKETPAALGHPPAPAAPDPVPERSAAFEESLALAPAAPESETLPGGPATSGDLAPEEIKAIRGSGAFGLLLIGALAAGILAGSVYYFLVVQPRQGRATPQPAAAAPAAEAPPPPATPAPAEAAPRPQEPPAAQAPAAAAEPAPSPAPALPAKAAAPSDAPAPPAAAAAGPAKVAEPPLASQVAAAALAAAKPAEPRAAPAAAAPPAPGPAAAPSVAIPAGVRPFDWYLQQALSLREHGQAQAAQQMYDKAEALDAQSAEPPTGIGYCLMDQRKPGAAVSHFKEALRRNPRFHDAILGLAEAYKDSGDKAHAIESYQRYLDEAPDGPEAPLAKAQIERLSKE